MSYSKEDNVWTEDLQKCLFKCIVWWKPTGLHRHFRMISIYQNLRTAAYDLDVEGEMTTQSIWNKLESLYHLESLNEREAVFAATNNRNSTIGQSDDEDDDHFFTLPESEFGHLKKGKSQRN